MEKLRIRKVEYFELSNDNFKKFLLQCRRAVNKTYGRKIAINDEVFSIRDENGLTKYENLKKTGKLEHKEFYKNDNDFYQIVFDFEFGDRVYAEKVEVL